MHFFSLWTLKWLSLSHSYFPNNTEHSTFLVWSFMLAILHDFKQNLELLALNCHAKDCCPFLRVGQNNGVILIYNTHFLPVKSRLIALIILLRSAKTFSLQVPIRYYFIWVFLFLSPHRIVAFKGKKNRIP